MSRAATNSAKRAAKLTAIEAAKAPEDRLINRKDFDIPVTELFTAKHQRYHNNIKRCFMEFLIHPDVHLCSSEEEAEKYFRPNGTPFTMRVCRMWLEGKATVRVGLVNDKLTIRTMLDHMYALQGSARQAGNPMDDEIVSNCTAWIYSSLLSRELVTTAKRQKHFVIHGDMTLLTQAIFSVEFIATLEITRTPLLMGLYLNLFLDCNSQPGELLDGSDEDNKIFDPNVPLMLVKDKTFRWSNVSIYAFPDKAKRVTFLAKVFFPELKSGAEVTESKTTQLRLLPLELAAEDSLRLLMILALVDDVFESHTTWSSLEQLTPPPHGTKVQFKISALQLPVFRGADGDRGAAPDAQIHSSRMNNWLDRLGVYLGLDSKLISGAIRRGGAYILAMCTTPEERRGRMGHGMNDETYRKHHRNEISTLDFQAYAHRTAPVDVSMLSSIFLDSKPDAPQNLSQEATAKVYAEPDLVAMASIRNEFGDTLILAHGSLAKAAKADACHYAQYLQALNNYKTSLSIRLRRAHEDEYASHFTKDSSSKPTASELSLLDTELISAVRQESFPGTFDSHSESSFVETKQVEHSGPLPSEDAPGHSRLNRTAEPEVRPVLESGPNLVIHTQRGLDRSIVTPWTVVDDVPDALSGSSNLSESKLADLLVKCFNHCHTSDTFYPGQEPLPGRLECRFCDEAIPKAASTKANKKRKKKLKTAKDTEETTEESDNSEAEASTAAKKSKRSADFGARK